MKAARIFFILFAMVSTIRVMAQLPNGDATFTLTAVDDFTGTAINTSTWYPGFTWTNEGHDNTILDPSNIIVSGGWMKLKLEDLRSAPVYSYSNMSGWQYWNYRGAAIQSKTAYTYGYYEISAKFPAGQGITPAFWTLGANTNTASPPTYYHEIDIVENNGVESNHGLMGMHMHYGDATGNICCDEDPAPSKTVAVSSPTSTHKYAVFWEPDNITWYLDDVAVGQLHDPTYTPQHPCYMLFDMMIDATTPGTVTATFPTYLEVDYMKISQLVPDCSTVDNICSFNSGTYTYKVKKSVTIGGSGCNNTINTSSNVNLWATDFVILDAGTVINDNGSGHFIARTTRCPQ